MSKPSDRVLWAVEWVEQHEWVPVAAYCYRTRVIARAKASRLRSAGVRVRIRKYAPTE